MKHASRSPYQIHLLHGITYVGPTGQCTVKLKLLESHHNIWAKWASWLSFKGEKKKDRKEMKLGSCQFFFLIADRLFIERGK